jgi:hypothetical protein
MTSNRPKLGFKESDPNQPLDWSKTTLPKIGRLIHVRGYDKCRAAIVTGQLPDALPPSVYVEIFSPNLKPQEAVLYVDSEWHYVDECTN